MPLFSAPLVSVVLPLHNGQEHFEQAVCPESGNECVADFSLAKLSEDRRYLARYASAGQASRMRVNSS